MPSSTDELQQLMTKEFGSIDSHGPEKFLTQSGYILKDNWYWKPPVWVKTYEDMSPFTYACLLFLVQEWDYGSIEF
jgi:hypothetical protein